MKCLGIMLLSLLFLSGCSSLPALAALLPTGTAVAGEGVTTNLMSAATMIYVQLLALWLLVPTALFVSAVLRIRRLRRQREHDLIK